LRACIFVISKDQNFNIDIIALNLCLLTYKFVVQLTSNVQQI